MSRTIETLSLRCLIGNVIFLINLHVESDSTVRGLTKKVQTKDVQTIRLQNVYTEISNDGDRVIEISLLSIS